LFPFFFRHTKMRRCKVPPNPSLSSYNSPVLCTRTSNDFICVYVCVCLKMACLSALRISSFLALPFSSWTLMQSRLCHNSNADWRRRGASWIRSWSECIRLFGYQSGAERGFHFYDVIGTMWNADLTYWKQTSSPKKITRILGPDVEVVDIFGWNWQKDEFSQGTWNVYRPGQMTRCVLLTSFPILLSFKGCAYLWFDRFLFHYSFFVPNIRPFPMEALCQNFWSQNMSEYFLPETTSPLGDFPFTIFLSQTDPHHSRISVDCWFVFSSQFSIWRWNGFMDGEYNFWSGVLRLT
jgi:hypothetical protein